jgi:hypothetical protein
VVYWLSKVSSPTNPLASAGQASTPGEGAVQFWMVVSSAGASRPMARAPGVGRVPTVPTLRSDHRRSARRSTPTRAKAAKRDVLIPAEAADAAAVDIIEVAAPSSAGESKQRNATEPEGKPSG